MHHAELGDKQESLDGKLKDEKKNEEKPEEDEGCEEEKEKEKDTTPDGGDAGADSSSVEDSDVKDETDADSDDSLILKPITKSDVTRTHYVQKSAHDQCQNDQCAAVFGIQNLLRAHHCRRCGEIFCNKCLIYRRRLNKMAQIARHGVHCKVCFHCFEERPLSWGPLVRSRTQEFLRFRVASMDAKRKQSCVQTLEKQDGFEEPVFWKEQKQQETILTLQVRAHIDVHQESKRLLLGFQSALWRSETIRTIQEIRGDLVQVPSWQKSSFWKLEKSQRYCRQCKERLKKHRKNCRVCGMALCKQCSVRELLLYYDDSDKPVKQSTEPKIVIIREDPAPEVEPNISLRLSVCADCRAEIVRLQHNDTGWFKHATRPLEGLALLHHTDQVFCDLQQNLTEEDSQEIQSEFLSRYQAQIEALEKLVTDKNFTGRHQTLLKNYTKAKRASYWTIRQRLGRSGRQSSIHSNVSLTSRESIDISQLNDVM